MRGAASIASALHPLPKPSPCPKGRLAGKKFIRYLRGYLMTGEAGAAPVPKEQPPR